MVEQIIETYWVKDESKRNLIGRCYKMPITRVEKYKVDEFWAFYTKHLMHLPSMQCDVERSYDCARCWLTNPKQDMALPLFEAYWGTGYDDTPGMAHVEVDWPFTIEGVIKAYHYEMYIKNQTQEEIDRLRKWYNKIIEEM